MEEEPLSSEVNIPLKTTQRPSDGQIREEIYVE